MASTTLPTPFDVARFMLGAHPKQLIEMANQCYDSAITRPQGSFSQYQVLIASTLFTAVESIRQDFRDLAKTGKIQQETYSHEEMPRCTRLMLLVLKLLDGLSKNEPPAHDAPIDENSIILTPETVAEFIAHMGDEDTVRLTEALPGVVLRLNEMAGPNQLYLLAFSTAMAAVVGDLRVGDEKCTRMHKFRDALRKITDELAAEAGIDINDPTA